ncbi:hypothetical protein T4E_4871 [Trichinella pseudospiralis]|uniref:Uncharacterized protein n=1 Tax=Trichinella pseudospiralis TaxID=6337 RepID=A0A0V0XYS5_TRIPS|nr:hypothetical protein T4E_4871 [Trichinella pseudospiralis]
MKLYVRVKKDPLPACIAHAVGCVMIKRPSGCSLIKVVQYQQGRCLFTQYRPVPVDCEASTFLGPGTGWCKFLF